MKPQYLDRRLTTCALCYCLCLSEKAFSAEVKRLGVKKECSISFASIGKARTSFVSPQHADVTRLTAIVCLDYEDAKKYTATQIAALLVHEAVHIWQAHAREIGSHNDHGDEEEAYAIQAIAQSLMEDFVRQTEMKK